MKKHAKFNFPRFTHKSLVLISMRMRACPDPAAKSYLRQSCFVSIAGSSFSVSIFYDSISNQGLATGRPGGVRARRTSAKFDAFYHQNLVETGLIEASPSPQLLRPFCQFTPPCHERLLLEGTKPPRPITQIIIKFIKSHYGVHCLGNKLV